MSEPHDTVIPLRDYLDQRLLDLEKRHDERYINQKDYNTQHNNLQREMKARELALLSKDEFRLRYDVVVERVVKLERWPFLFGALFGIVQFITIIVLKFWR